MSTSASLLPRLRSGALAAWVNAWLDGRVGIDQVVDAVAVGDAPHTVVGLGPDDLPLSELLVAWRRDGGRPRCVLPAAGDVRGVPGPARLRAAALEAEEAVVGDGLSAVPQTIEHLPSSAPTTVRWHTYVSDPAPPDFQDVSDAQYELATAIRESAGALAAADVANWREGLDAGLRDARRAGERLRLPPGHPTRAVALLAQAERLQAVLDLALADPTGGAIDQYAMAGRAAALRPLVMAVRRARVIGYNAGA